MAARLLGGVRAPLRPPAPEEPEVWVCNLGRAALGFVGSLRKDIPPPPKKKIKPKSQPAPCRPRSPHPTHRAQPLLPCRASTFAAFFPTCSRAPRPSPGRRGELAAPPSPSPKPAPWAAWQAASPSALRGGPDGGGQRRDHPPRPPKSLLSPHLPAAPEPHHGPAAPPGSAAPAVAERGLPPKAHHEHGHRQEGAGSREPRTGGEL